MQLALVQCSAGPDREQNLRQGLQAVERAAAEGAQLVCFPELAFDRFLPQQPAAGDVRKLAEPVPGPTTRRFQELAAALGVVIVLNLFERDGDRCYDCSPVIDADGRLLGRTRMLHIAEMPGFHEQGYYSPGDLGMPVFQTRHCRLGVCICYDRHYPELLRALALGGAELVLVPQAGAVGEWPPGLFEAELQVAAFQNGYYAALCNRVGVEPRLRFSGGSYVAAPDGSLLAQAGDEAAILQCGLDLSAVADSHARRLFLRDRRAGLCSRLLTAPDDE